MIKGRKPGQELTLSGLYLIVLLYLFEDRGMDWRSERRPAGRAAERPGPAGSAAAQRALPGHTIPSETDWRVHLRECQDTRARTHLPPTPGVPSPRIPLKRR